MAENKLTNKLIENRDRHYPDKYWGYTYNISLFIIFFWNDWWIIGGEASNGNIVHTYSGREQVGS